MCLCNIYCILQLATRVFPLIKIIPILLDLSSFNLVSLQHALIKAVWHALHAYGFGLQREESIVSRQQ